MNNHNDRFNQRQSELDKIFKNVARIEFIKSIVTLALSSITVIFLIWMIVAFMKYLEII